MIFLNSTLYVLDKLKYAEVGWSGVAVILSIIGNSTLLYSSIKHRSIRLDRVTIVLLENLAVADIGLVIFGIIPRAVHVLRSDEETLYGRDLPNKIILIPRLTCTAMNVCLVPVLNLTKLLSLKFPFRVRSLRYRHGYMAVVALWVSSGIICAGVIGGTNFLTNFNYILFLSIVAVLMFMLLLILGSTLALLLTVRKARGLTKQGFLSVTYVSIVFILCYIPMWAVTWIFPFYVTRIFYCISYICCFSNCIICYLTIRSFKQHIDDLIKEFDVSSLNAEE